MDKGLNASSHEPDLSQFRAFGLLITYCLIYVLPLYASPATRAVAGRPRDAPEAIRARIRSVSLSTALCSLVTFVLVKRSPISLNVSPWNLMGYWPIGMVEAGKTVLLTGLLFLGPLYECLLIDGNWRSWSSLDPLKQVWSDLAVWRNMVAGPITEECLFRSSAVPLLLMAGCDRKSIIFLSPLVFGLAHLHHFYEFRVTHPRTQLGVAVARSVLQLSYTTVFGAYATFLFLRTGSLLAVVAVHTFCNSMGLPRVWGLLEPYWLLGGSNYQKISALKWTIPYYVLLLGGLVLWWQHLLSLTTSSTALFTLEL
ncbi:hypothetical protein C2857_001996 [Epichloe festucae Fl1]|uniref:intramembrane prenyl-peptidase Rce1 n=1 Tax=Epichloe festucae (strain Fl1) TaxID=877507 RepID=A0A7S9PTM2_EPIFF|nr:hypothetical protein C2857_001996 [Epichloe festucae Fl1]